MMRPHETQQAHMDNPRIQFLEMKMQSLEQDYHHLYQQNAKMKNQYATGG